MATTDTHERDKQFMIECLTSDIILMLMEDRGLSMAEAMSLLYNSKTYEKLEDERTGLYYQGAVYVMEFLEEELQKEKV
ncbi:MAG: hypothetical protein MJY63_03025 [Paludibacteraceae bacterium]|nr:hypothetical protein [Paludibacteraceae bacterium]